MSLDGYYIEDLTEGMTRRLRQDHHRCRHPDVRGRLRRHQPGASQRGVRARDGLPGPHRPRHADRQPDLDRARHQAAGSRLHLSQPDPEVPGPGPRRRHRARRGHHPLDRPREAPRASSTPPARSAARRCSRARRSRWCRAGRPRPPPELRTARTRRPLAGEVGEAQALPAGSPPDPSAAARLASLQARGRMGHSAPCSSTVITLACRQQRAVPRWRSATSTASIAATAR